MKVVVHGLMSYVVLLYDHSLVLFVVVCGKRSVLMIPSHWCENLIAVLVQIATC